MRKSINWSSNTQAQSIAQKLKVYTHCLLILEYYDQGFDVILNLNSGSNYGVLLSYNEDIYYIHNPGIINHYILANKEVNKIK